MGHSSKAGENIFWAMNRNKPGIIKRILNALERFIARIRGKDAYLAVEQRQAAERLRDMLTGELKRAYGTDVKGEAAVESGEGKRHSLAGANSQTADLNSLGGAYQMYQNGVSMDTIRKRTGWWLGKDGKWRYEISDKEMRFNPEGYVDNPQTVGDYVKHDRLFAAYPWIMDVNVLMSENVAGDPNSLGRYVPSENFIELKTGVPTEKTKHVLIHELQHAIQNKEHFTNGTNSTVTSRYIVNLAYNNVKNNPEFKAEKSPRGKMDYIIGYLEARMDANFDDIAKYYYSRNHGEIEAQYVDKRLDMSDNARKAEPIVNYGDVYTREEKAMIDKLYGDTGMMQIYLMDTGYRPNNREWAAKYAIPTDPEDKTSDFCLTTHPEIVNGFVNQFRQYFAEHGIHGNEAVIKDSHYGSYENKLLILNPSVLAEEYRDGDYQYFFARSGFGCDPSKLGTAVYGEFLIDGEHTHFARGDFLGVADEEQLPEWAKEKLAEITSPEENQNEGMGEIQ